MKVKYNKSYYKCSFIDALRINSIKFILFLKRQKYRVMHLHLVDEFLLYSFITIFWLIYCFFIYNCGTFYYSETETAYRFIDALWEVKNSYFTSVILALTIAVCNKLQNHKKLMIQQHITYVDAMCTFESLIEYLLEREYVNSCHPLYSKECLQDTIDYIIVRYNISNEDMSDEVISNINKPELTLTTSELTHIIDKINHQLVFIENEIQSQHIRYTDTTDTLYVIENAKEKLYDMLCSMLENDEISIIDIFDISYTLCEILDEIRKPWRCNIKLNKKILTILNKHPENEIDDHFYYGMLLNGIVFNIIE